MEDGTNALTENAASSKQVRNARKRERILQRQREDAWRNQYTTVHGVRVMIDVLEQCGVFRDTDMSDTNAIMKAIGKRSIGLFTILQSESVVPNALTLIREQYHKDAANR